MLITVFTPTYNRGYTLERIYKSLCRQTSSDFEWIVVDDGSSDNTADIVNAWVSEAQFPITYVKQANGGKHRAINRGLFLAKGQYFYIVDSDDALTDDAVEFIIREGSEILVDSSFAGLSGCDMTYDGRIITNMRFESLDTDAISFRTKYNISGDFAEVFKTEVLRRYPFPEIEGEKFCPEAVVWDRIAADGLKLRYFSKILKIIEYLPDGLTSSIVKIRLKSPVASTICYSELLRLDIPFRSKLRAAINYWRFRLCKSRHKKPSISAKWLWTFPLGVAMHLKDRRIIR